MKPAYDSRAEEFQRAMDEAPDHWEAFREPERSPVQKSDFKVYAGTQRPGPARHIGRLPNASIDDMLARVDAEGRGDIRNIQLPYPHLNRSVGNGFALRNITALVASPGASKTWWAINFLLHAQSQGYRWRYLPLEDSADMWIQKFLAAKLCDWRIVSQPGSNDPQERVRLAEHKQNAMKANRIFLEDLRLCVAENPRTVPDPITGDVRAEVHYEDILTFIKDEADVTDIVCVDPVSQIDFSIDGRDYVGQAKFMQRLSAIVNRCNVHVVLVVHTAKQTPGNDPTSAVGGSAKITQLSQNVLMLQRHDPAVEDEIYSAYNPIVEHKLTMTVVKSRAGLSGQKFAFDFLTEGPAFREYGTIKLKPTKRKAGQ